MREETTSRNEVERIIRHISDRLSEFLVVTDDPYAGATDFNRTHPLFSDLRNGDRTGQRMSPIIHREVIGEISDKFSLSSKKVGTSHLTIDFWDEQCKIAYEIVMGNGEEIWKDILKAILVKADKLVVFCRDYPDETIKGYSEITHAVRNLEEFLEGKLYVEIVRIKPKISGSP
jgi:hypothetical protein